ncbi:hypothetical protein [Mycobacterium sp. M23085]|uniref:hypothetical protein n=1 Tax=Mycobacterium sp. M23085 TaxID=3378087 RepID=UPI003877CE16
MANSAHRDHKADESRQVAQYRDGWRFWLVGPEGGPAQYPRPPALGRIGDPENGLELR